MGYADHVTELKYLKNKDPGRFKLDNDMSLKKLPPLVEPPADVQEGNY